MWVSVHLDCDQYSTDFIKQCSQDVCLSLWENPTVCLCESVFVCIWLSSDLEVPFVSQMLKNSVIAQSAHVCEHVWAPCSVCWMVSQYWLHVKDFCQTPGFSKRHTHTHSVHTCPLQFFSFQLSDHGQKVLEPVGGLYRCAHTHMHTLTVVCICESELSVLLSHTIHHKLLILLDHCGAFRTPRCSLKTQSEANAPNLPEAHTQAQALTLSFQLACTHKGPEGTAMVFRVPASPTP